MLSHKEIRNLKKLHQKKYRDADNCYLIEGVHGVNEAVKAAPLLIQMILKTPDMPVPEGFGGRLEDIESHQYASISMMKTPPNIMAVMQKKVLNPWDGVQHALTFYLDGIRDPGNLGTIIRSSDWFGYKNLIVSADTVDLYNPKVVQATMGSIHRVDVYRDGIDLDMAELAAHRVIIGTDMQGEDYRLFETKEKQIIVIGSESHGMSDMIQAQVQEYISIPSHGQAESLNASIAHAVLASRFSE